jgi:dihydropteroate synthase
VSELHCGVRTLDLSAPRVMGVINLTPDSFSDGGRFVGAGGRVDPDAALDCAHAMLAAGAAILDVGGESTRPGAEPVPVAVELQRVMPVVERLAELDTIVSVDTSKAEVARAALAAGASMINDVSALRDPDMLTTLAASGAGVCLMHMQGEPATMQSEPHYDDVVAEVVAFLAERAGRAVGAGIDAARIVVDPGIGFGKTLDHNLALLHALGELAALGYPVLVGVSRKRMLGTLTARDVEDRLAAGLGAAVAAVANGAALIRTHDVAATIDALTVASAVWNGRAVQE